MNLDNLQVANFQSGSGQNVQVFQNAFGPILEFPVLSQERINPNVSIQWVWFPKTNTNKVSMVVYNHFNNRHIYEETWSGWKNILNLNASPRVKYFV